MLPPHSVPKASKYSTPAVIARAVEVSEKYSLVTWPVVNMWCAHTLIDNTVKPSREATIGP